MVVRIRCREIDRLIEIVGRGVIALPEPLLFGRGRAGCERAQQERPEERCGTRHLSSAERKARDYDSLPRARTSPIVQRILARKLPKQGDVISRKEQSWPGNGACHNCSTGR